MRAIALMLVYTPLALSLAAFDGFPSINPIRPGLPSAPSAIKRARHDAPHGKLSGWQHIYHGAHQSAPNASPRVGSVDFTPHGSEQASGGPGHRAIAIGCAHAPGVHPGGVHDGRIAEQDAFATVEHGLRLRVLSRRVTSPTAGGGGGPDGRLWSRR